MNPKVSVLIYVKNDQSHIEKCIRSVMGQTLHDIEILVIDGGSIDGTLERIENLSSEDKRIRLISSESGVGLQFNTGLKMACGKYIGICESDDYICHDMYERQYEISERYQLDILKSNVIRFCEARGKEYRFPFSLSSDLTLYGTLLNPQEDFRFLKLGVSGFWSGIYRREFLLENSIYMNETDGASYQDITFSFLTGAYAKRVYVMREAFYCYRMDNPNSSINNPRKVSLLYDEYKMLKNRLKTAGIWERYKEIFLSWKLNGHLWFYDNLSDNIKNDYISLCYKDIRREIDEEKYREMELSIKEQATYRAGNASLDEFKDYIKSVDDTWLDMERKFDQLDLKKDILIFGAGNLGVLVNLYLKEKKKTAVACLDNDSRKWNNYINDLLVLSPNTAVKQYENAVYVIANATCEQEIKKQLIGLGLQESDIVICNNYDAFLKRVLIRAIKSV